MSFVRGLLGHSVYLGVMVVIALAIPPHSTSDLTRGLLVVGVIGTWRYSWALINFSRALIYLKLAYPRLRARMEAAYAKLPVKAHAYFLVTSYKIDAETTSRVYRSIFQAAKASPGGATIVASVVDTSDARLIQRIFDGTPGCAGRVKLTIDQIAGTGKRDALARSLRLIAREAPTRHDILAFVDGDSCVPEDLAERAAPFFTDPRVGALTTDEKVEIKDSPLFRDWFMMRFTQRQVMMSSLGLSGRVLTLTGRMSVIRADLATRPDFINMVEADFIEHWRLGRVNFLTGDDKSTWFWLLKNGYLMRYLPDVASVSMESQPKPGFMDSAITLMTRWFGNMLRTNGRALALSPSKIGLFTWWSILDQRLGIWTTLAGPISVLIGAIFVTPLVIPAYLVWVMFTRYVFSWILSLARGGGFPITYPFLLYFSQIVGASVKSYILFRLDRQRWTRQSAAKRKGQTLSFGARARAWSSVWVHSLALGWLTFGVVLLSGLL